MPVSYLPISSSESSQRVSGWSRGSGQGRCRDGAGRVEEAAGRHAVLEGVEGAAREADPRQPQARRDPLQGERGKRGGRSSARWRHGPGHPPAEAKKEEGVIDAEYVDVEEK